MLLHRIGRIFSSSEFSEFSTHAQVPTAFLFDTHIRVYFAARDESGKSYTTFVDFDRNDPTRMLRLSKQRALLPGKPGTFDDEGNMPSQVVRDGERLLLFYSGWNQRVSVPYHNSTGLAQSLDGGETFERVFEGPVLERTPREPYLAVTPSILKEGKLFRCWYISGLRWVQVAGKFEPVYVIKSAVSNDGVEWQRDGRQVIPSHFENEAFSRPTVFRKDGQYHMLFCARGSEDYRNGSQAYRFGYATSPDGNEWIRHDDRLQWAGPKEDWESKMTCYPFHLEMDGEDYIFYNGNGFGQSGFGLARVELK